MTLNEYQEEALRTAQLDKQLPSESLTNVALGLAGEAGEFADAIKKSLFQGHELDVNHLSEELGDILWYIAVGAKALGVELEKTARGNVEKLKKRYPDGFSTECSVHREV